MKSFLKKRMLFLHSYVICCTPVLAETTFIDLPNPPPGFESVPINQHLRVSVFFMQRYIGFFYINIHQGALKFHSPDHVLTQLKGIKNKKKVLRLFNQSFPLHIECSPNGIASVPSSCLSLKQTPVYIIYNPSQEAAYLYLNSSYFKQPSKINAIDFIPKSTSEWSYLNKLGAAGSFSDNNPFFMSQPYPSMPNYYNLYSNNVLAYGNSSIIGNLSQNNGINNGQFFQVQNLYAQHIERDKIYTSGYMTNSTSPFFQTQTIAGAGIRTTLDTVKNSENLKASPLVIFVPQASQISIFKNEQLIFSQYLEAGYQRMALFSDILLNSNQGLFDFDPAFFLGNSFIKTAGLITTKNNYGIYTMVNAQRHRLNINMMATKIFYQEKNTDYFFLNNVIDNNSLSVSYRLSDHDLLGIQANYNKVLSQPDSYNAGAFYQR